MDVFSSVKDEIGMDIVNKLQYHKYYNKRNIFLSKIFKSKQSLIVSRPACIIIETVNYCNHNCIFCPNELMTRERSVMTMKVFEKAISDYLEMGGGHLSLTPMIGDVFLDPLLIQRLEYLQKFSDRITLSITTNGVFADKFTDDELSFILGNFKRIQISIYGLSKQEYMLITKKETYSRFLSSIKKVIAFSPPDVVTLGFRLVNSRDDIELISWITDNLGVIIPYSSTIQYNNWSCNELNFELPGDAIWCNQNAGSLPCILPLISIQVFVNGDVSMCACADYDSSPDLKIGSIINESLESMYNSEKVRTFFFKPWIAPDFCKKCSFYRSLDDLNQEWVDNPITIIGG